MIDDPSMAFCPSIALQKGALPPDWRGARGLNFAVSPAEGHVVLDVIGDIDATSLIACWDGSWIETSPPGITIMLGHASDTDRVPSETAQALRIDLSTALRERPRLWAMIVGNDTMSSAVEIGIDTV